MRSLTYCYKKVGDVIENLHERNLYWNYRLVLMHCACYSYGPSEEGTIYLYLFYVY